MQKEYECGYRAGYKKAKEEFENSDAYLQGYKDAVKYMQLMLTVTLAKKDRR